MRRCKHYPGITNQQLKNLENLLNREVEQWDDQASEEIDEVEDLCLSLVYDPLKKILKISYSAKTQSVPEAHVWKILDKLLTYGAS